MLKLGYSSEVIFMDNKVDILEDENNEKINRIVDSNITENNINKDDGMKCSVISFMLFLLIFVSLINVSIETFTCNGDSVCVGAGFLFFFTIMFSFFPILISFILGIVALIKYNRFKKEKRRVRKIFNILNIISLIVMGMLIIFECIFLRGMLFI